MPAYCWLLIGIPIGALLTVAVCLVVFAVRESERERRVVAGGSGPQDSQR